MYTEISIVILIGLVIVFILIHYDFKDKLFDIENKLQKIRYKYFREINSFRKDINKSYEKILNKTDDLCLNKIQEDDYYPITNLVVDVLDRNRASGSINCLDLESSGSSGSS
tara:strand:+ start:73 stop:408 length:336 start_codon:yes stop_codon:yes gene_type:complete